MDLDIDDMRDIMARDSRFHVRAYNFLMQTIRSSQRKRQDVVEFASTCDDFHEAALDRFGPLAYTVLSGWGVKSYYDVGDMLRNLVESGRISANEESADCDFSEMPDFEFDFLDQFRP